MVYFNIDIVVFGSYVLIVFGSLLVKNIIVDFSKKVDDFNVYDDKKIVFDILFECNLFKNNLGKLVVGNLGFGSDFVLFY